MIYTVGHRESYERYFAENNSGGTRKLGRDKGKDGYPGGSVWKTREEAALHCPDDYAVYGVEADWDNDTVATSEPGGAWHDLLKTSDLIRLH